MREDTRKAEPVDEFRTGIAARLRARNVEIAEAIYVGVWAAAPDPVGGSDPTYQAGLRSAITALVDYGLGSIEAEDEWSEPIPSAATAQGRLAARTGVSLGTVMRRYFAGHAEFGEFVMREAQDSGVSNPALHRIRRTQEALLAHLTAAVEHEYNQEREHVARAPDQHRADIVKRLLAGGSDPDDLAELAYEIHGSWHLGLVATGAGAEETLHKLMAHFGRRLLPVFFDGTAFAWLGAQITPTTPEIDTLAADTGLVVSLGIGEPGSGIDGWRLTHHQARDALRIALRGPTTIARYGDDRLLAGALPNETLVKSLKQKYLIPLGGQRDGGATLRHTLRTYIDLECNASSAAEVLRVGRRAVKSRVCVAERLIGCTVRQCLAELDVALRIEALGHDATGEDAVSS